MEHSNRTLDLLSVVKSFTMKKTCFCSPDKNGNLSQQPPVTYDNEINPYVLSSTPQLINRDYSVNNVLDNFIIKYNEYGLPVKYVSPGFRFTKFGIECGSL